MCNDMFGLKREVIESIKKSAAACDIEKLILFGSRARGDYRETSDIDLAICGGNGECFAIDVEEKVPTLLKFDVVDMDKPVQQELVESIEREGIVIYEKI